ncbi:MAG: cell division protein SepF [Propionibacteriaceae bacterium]|jgi:cell division inhibitor SepF|nr:cell division protein SepF [Propionibacteriaceae bacterium]
MPSNLKKVVAWLGLAPGESYLDSEADATQEVATASKAVARVVDADAGPAHADLSEIRQMEPHTFNEAREIGECLRDGIPVIMNLNGMVDADARRLVDFGSGLTFGVNGRIRKVGHKVFMLLPPNVALAAEDEKLLADGFYNQS